MELQRFLDALMTHLLRIEASIDRLTQRVTVLESTTRSATDAALLSVRVSADAFKDVPPNPNPQRITP